MNPQSIGEDELHGLADGRLSAIRRSEVEAWLIDHPQAAEQVHAWRGQNALLHLAFDRVLEAPLPARLLDTAQRPARFSTRRFAAAVAWLALGGIIGFFVRGEYSRPASPQFAPQLAHQAALAHAVYSPEVRHPVEVGAEQEAHLAAWLSKRLGASLKPPHLEEAGYALLGGRLLPGETDGGNGAVAQFMYQDQRGARLTLYVRNDSGASNTPNAANTQETAFRFASEGKIRVFYWLDGRLGYALSGEAERPELLRIANIVYRQLNP